MIELPSCHSIVRSPPGKSNGNRALRDAFADRRDRSGASSGPACPCKPSAAFPNPQIDMIIANHIRDVYVHAFGEEWIILNLRAKFREVDIWCFRREEHHMRIANVDRHGIP